MNEQQKFWSTTYATEYIEKNTTFDSDLGSKCWRAMLSKSADVRTILECGCNIGRNIGFLRSTNPESEISIIEISEPAFNYVTSTFELDKCFNGPIVNANFDTTFDILIGEYFSRTPQMIEYQGQSDRLFKRDFGKLFIDNFNVQLVDYGFLWGHLYDSAGFDDITWWLFEK